MIGFNHFENLGGLGNQMFEFAALGGIATKNNYDYSDLISERWERI
jgi:hypothetical protein